MIAAACGGCALYKPDPIDIRRDTEEWKKVSLSLIPAGRTLPYESLKKIGLLLNADLNKARLTYRKTSDIAKNSGYWEDPSLSFDGARYLHKNLYDYNLSRALSIPVTGAPAIARKVAELYKETDYQELRAQENDFLVRLQTLCYTIRIAHTKHELIRNRLQQIENEQKNIEQLHRMGEASAGDLHEALQRRNDTLKELQELDNDHLAKHLELTSMLGLHPAVGDVEVAGSLPHGVPPSVAPPTDEILLRHPRLLAAMSAYKTSEQELRLEIRKQYPELQVGSSFAREEQEQKAGLSVGFTLPLWNRNREAIARARGGRSISRHSAIQQWRDLTQQAHALQRRQQLAMQHCQSEHERLTALQETMAQQERLYTLGEINLPTLATTRHEAYTRRLAYLDCLAELLEIQVALQHLSTPNPA